MGLRRALIFGVILGVTLGVYRIAFVYLIESSPLRPAFPVLFPGCATAIAVAALWPRWFDPSSGPGWVRRFVCRVVAGAAAVVLAGATALLLIVAWPGYLAWEYNMHRVKLAERGGSDLEITRRLDAHRQTAVDFFGEGARTAAHPAIVATLVTAAVGGIAARRRRTSLGLGADRP